MSSIQALYQFGIIVRGIKWGGGLAFFTGTGLNFSELFIHEKDKIFCPFEVEISLLVNLCDFSLCVVDTFIQQSTHSQTFRAVIKSTYDYTLGM